MSNPSENIDEYWATIKNVFFSGAPKFVGHVSMGRHKIWLNAESWKRIDEQKGLKILLTVASAGVTRSNSNTE